MVACEKHRAKPAKGYNECPGCEVEALRAERDELLRDLAACRDALGGRWDETDLAAEAIGDPSAVPLRVQEKVASMRGLLLWTLYHHQGGSSDIGQPIRRALGIGQHDRLTDEQIAEAKAAAAMPANVKLTGRRRPKAGGNPTAQLLGGPC